MTLKLALQDGGRWCCQWSVAGRETYGCFTSLSKAQPLPELFERTLYPDDRNSLKPRGLPHSIPVQDSGMPLVAYVLGSNPLPMFLVGQLYFFFNGIVEVKGQVQVPPFPFRRPSLSAILLDDRPAWLSQILMFAAHSEEFASRGKKYQTSLIFSSRPREEFCSALSFTCAVVFTPLRSKDRMFTHFGRLRWTELWLRLSF